MENKGGASGSPRAVEKHDGTGEEGDFVPTLGLGCSDQGNRRRSWPVVSTR
jgi:hypothetical protein